MKATKTRYALLGATVMLWAALAPATAQEWPSRNVTVVVPIPGRRRQRYRLSRHLRAGRKAGRTDLRDRNRVGAGGTIGANMVAKAAPDGHTILVYGSIAAANALYTKLPYDTATDFVPSVLFGQTPLVVVTGAGRYKTLSELVATAKAKPGALNYSTVGVGSAAHFGAARLEVGAGFTAQHIPFKGGEWLTEIIAGRIDFAVSPVTSAFGAIKDGKLVPLAVMSAKRMSSLPDVPTMIEAGLTADAIYPFYTGAYLPAKTPRAIVEKLHNEVVKALALPEFRNGWSRSVSSRCR